MRACCGADPLPTCCTAVPVRAARWPPPPPCALAACAGTPRPTLRHEVQPAALPGQHIAPCVLLERAAVGPWQAAGHSRPTRWPQRCGAGGPGLLVCRGDQGRCAGRRWCLVGPWVAAAAHPQAAEVEGGIASCRQSPWRLGGGGKPTKALVSARVAKQPRRGGGGEEGPVVPALPASSRVAGAQGQGVCSIHGSVGSAATAAAAADQGQGAGLHPMGRRWRVAVM